MVLHLLFCPIPTTRQCSRVPCPGRGIQFFYALLHVQLCVGKRKKSIELVFIPNSNDLELGVFVAIRGGGVVARQELKTSEETSASVSSGLFLSYVSRRGRGMSLQRWLENRHAAMKKVKGVSMGCFSNFTSLRRPTS